MPRSAPSALAKTVRAAGYAQVSWSPEQLTVADAVARLALDGDDAPIPVLEAPSWAPADRFHLHWSLACAARLLGRDPRRAFACAHDEARAIPDPRRRDLALILGTLALDAWRDASAAESWAADVASADLQFELSAHRIARDVAEGDLARALERLRALPPSWGMSMVPRDWEGYPPSLGGQAEAVCLALATSPSHADERRALTAHAEEESQKVAEDWRRNRTWRAIAYAWAQVGDFERAVAATEQIPDGRERSEAIAEVLSEAGAATDAARLGALVERSLHAAGLPSAAALVLREPGQAFDAVAFQSFIAGVERGTIACGLVRASSNQGDHERAKALLETISPDLAVRARANGHYLGALAAAGHENVARRELAIARPVEAYLAAFLEGLALAGSPGLAGEAAAPSTTAPQLVTSFVQTLVSLGLVDDALALHCAHREHAEPLVRVEQLGMVLAGLALSSRWEDSRALLEGSAPFPYPLLEARIATWSLRLVPGLVASGQTEKATALASTTRTRLAAGPTLA